MLLPTMALAHTSEDNVAAFVADLVGAQSRESPSHQRAESASFDQHL